MIVEFFVGAIDATLFARGGDVAPKGGPAFQAHNLGGLGVHRAGRPGLFVVLLFLDHSRAVAHLTEDRISRVRLIGLPDILLLGVGAGSSGSIEFLGHSGKLAALLATFPMRWFGWCAWRSSYFKMMSRLQACGGLVPCRGFVLRPEQASEKI